MDLFPKNVDFDTVWTRLRSATSAFISGRGQLSKAVWKDRFLDVYILCIAEPKPFGERLYNELKDFFEQHVSDIHQEVLSRGEENILFEYYKNWQTYSAGVPYLNQLYGYLNTHVAKRLKYCLLNIDYSLYGIDHSDNTVEIAELALDCWMSTMVNKRRTLLVEVLLKEIAKDRSGIIVNHPVLQGVIMSFVHLLQFRISNQLRLYEDLFEIPFMKASNSFFQQQSQTLRDTCDVPTFVAKVATLLNDEAVRSRRYLHESSHVRIVVDCQSALLTDDNVDFINAGCRQLVRKEQWTDLAATYRLLDPLEDKLGVLVSETELHLQDVGLSAVQCLPATRPRVAKQFVETVVNFHSKYRQHIVQTFKSNPKFLAALDKACVVVVNFKDDPKTMSRGPELLSQFCDELLQKGVKGQSETEIDDWLNHIITLFDYVEDKDIFERFYARALGRRLIFGQSVSMELEEAMINRLKSKCGSEYSNKLHQMFTDIALSSDLNTKFNNFLDTSHTKQHALNISVLQAGAWPISQSSVPSVCLPKELERTVQLFEEFYSAQFSGRKLAWLHSLSHVELRLSFCPRTYFASVDMATSTILLSFNDVIGQCPTSSSSAAATIVFSLTFEELLASTRLSTEELLKKLQALIDTKLLHNTTQGPLGPESVLQLNMAFSNKRTKFKIFSISLMDVKQESMQTHAAIEYERRLFIQATIVRIMKARKELRHSTLVEEVIVQTRSRFTPPISTIKRCIDVLMEKEYIERVPNTPENYVYIA